MMNVNAIERKRRRKNIKSIMQVFLTSNKRNSKEYVLILFIYSTVDITKKGKGGKKKTLCSSMPEICHHSKIDRRRKKKKLVGRIEIKANE